MKIKKSITNKVKASIHDCRATVNQAIIDLCELVDTKQSGTILFERPFVMSKSEMCKKEISFATGHMVINKIIYGPLDRMDKSFILGYDENCLTSSIFLSLGDLIKVYEELKITVRHE